ncbi:MAG: choice-of-anchor Q domain-containing protein, partial [Candidatus Tenebribacter mawsonii]|nr:choice-of-anchor Q domain-containing protein [Candidatus Tenebribacter mawsonii]
MKKKHLFLLFVFVSVCSLLNSVTYHIKQDGTGNFITIQEGIVAATNSDTILVYPGTYYENIDYLEKSLTVASLYMITPEDSLINQTIIDGNQQARCVTIDESEDVSLIGFTIQNGLALGDASNGRGGGILIKEVSNTLIANCMIKNNKSNKGGGIWIYSGNTSLKGNTISHNWALQSGGGIRIIGYVQFDDMELNNIFLNYSGTGVDIFISEYLPNITEVIVDTFTVAEPGYFFIAAKSDTYTLTYLNNKIEQIDQDLYVAPEGDDDNSGLTPNDPLQTIAWAQTLIKRNDEEPHTINLAQGIYSPLLNNQKFPIGIKHGIKYIGTSPEETILDAENQSTIIRYTYYPENELPKLYIENIKLINGSSGGKSYGAIFTLKTNIELYNVIINDCYGDTSSGILNRDGIYNFKNVKVMNNSGGSAILISCIHAENPQPIMQISMENVLIQNNYPGQGEMAGSGGGSNLRGHSEIIGDYYTKLINCEISSNYSNFINSGVGGTAGLYTDDLTADIVNCTFGNNTVDYATGCVITANNSQLNLYNSIVYNNDGHSFNLWYDAEINIQNSLIEDSTSNIGYFGNGNGIVNWLEGNIDEDPMFDSLGIYPFALLENSPCINTGTLDLPIGIELPEFDLAGNPRIYGETIDMGAYEYQGEPQSNDENEIIIPKITQISNYPNPFNPSTTIKLDLAESGKIELAIYNIKGQKVKTLLDAYSSKGHFEIIWRG